MKRKQSVDRMGDDLRDAKRVEDCAEVAVADKTGRWENGATRWLHSWVTGLTA
jgi:hypothetical protein